MGFSHFICNNAHDKKFAKIERYLEKKNTYKRGSMTSFTDLHLELEIKAKDFFGNPTEANGNRIIEEIVRLIKMNASIFNRWCTK